MARSRRGASTPRAPRSSAAASSTSRAATRSTSRRSAESSPTFCFFGGFQSAKNCDFTDCSIFGLNAQNLRQAVSDAKSLPLERWLFAVGIPQVGVTVAKDIAAEHEKFSDLKDSQVLRNVVENDAKKGRERKILAIKVEAAKAVLGFFDSAYGAAFLGRMLALGIDPKRGERAAAATEGPLAGAGCVLTGTLSRPRGEYAALIEAAGGIVQSAVTSKTKYLIAGANVGATKTEKARKLGTEVIDEARLLELLGAARGGGAQAAPEQAKPSAPTQGELF